VLRGVPRVFHKNTRLLPAFVGDMKSATFPEFLSRLYQTMRVLVVKKTPKPLLKQSLKSLLNSPQSFRRNRFYNCSIVPLF